MSDEKWHGAPMLFFPACAVADVEGHGPPGLCPKKIFREVILRFSCVKRFLSLPRQSSLMRRSAQIPTRAGACETLRRSCVTLP